MAKSATVYYCDEFEFDMYLPYEDVDVVAYDNRARVWETVRLGDVQCDRRFTKLFVHTDLTPVAPVRTPSERVLAEFDGLIEWVKGYTLTPAGCPSFPPTIEREIGEYRSRIEEALSEI